MNIIQAVKDPNLFADWFLSATWNAWRVFLAVLFGLPLTPEDRAVYHHHTQRSDEPQTAFREAWLVVGRRGGKSLIAALVAVFLAVFKDYSPYLKPGEVATIAIIAADRKQARTILRYIRGFLKLAMLREYVLNDTQEAIELKGQVQIEVHSGSFRSTRGYTFAAVIGDEIAFWRDSETSANPDKEIIAAVRPGLATIPGSLLLVISSPYARRGALWTAYSKFFGKESRVLVWQGTTMEMNPSIDPAIIEQALEEDEAAAQAEYMAQFRRDIEAFIAREAVDGCTIPGRLELPPMPGIQYVAFTDPSGGTNDSFTLAIAHTLQTSAGSTAVLDAVREIRPPFSPEAAIAELCDVLKSYQVSKVFGDRYAGEFPREQFFKKSISYELSEKPKSEIYRDVLPLLNSGRVELLDLPRLSSQLLGLERRTGRSGKDSIDHAPNAHDDVVNAVAGALLQCSKPGQFVFFGSMRPDARWLTIVDGREVWSDADEPPAAAPEPIRDTERKSNFYSVEN